MLPRGPRFDPGQETRSHMPQLKILDATAKTWHSQRNNNIFFKGIHLAAPFCQLYSSPFSFLWA